jgi:hypothetical protein
LLIDQMMTCLPKQVRVVDVDAQVAGGDEGEERRVEGCKERHGLLVKVARVAAALGQDGLKEGKVGNELVHLGQAARLLFVEKGWLIG